MAGTHAPRSGQHSQPAIDHRPHQPHTAAMTRGTLWEGIGPERITALAQAWHDRGPGGWARVLARVQPRARTPHRRLLGAGVGRSVRLHGHDCLLYTSP